MKKVVFVGALTIGCLACASPIPVATMESVISETVVAAKSAGRGAVTNLQIELAVIGGWEAAGGVNSPIPVVPISLSGKRSKSESTKVTFEIDLKKYPDEKPKGLDVYLLNPRTRKLGR